MDTKQAAEWIQGTPFPKGEEHLQYLTFLARDKGDNLLRTVGAWDDGKGGMKPINSEQRSGGRSGAATPMSSQAPKKKITLTDYKRKATGEAAAKNSTLKPVSPRPEDANKSQEEGGENLHRVPEVKVPDIEPEPPKSLKRHGSTSSSRFLQGLTRT